jgi:hypothetical protein
MVLKVHGRSLWLAIITNQSLQSNSVKNFNRFRQNAMSAPRVANKMTTRVHLNKKNKKTYLKKNKEKK